MLQKKSIAYKQALKFSFNAFIDNFSFYLKVYIVFFLVSAVCGISVIGFMFFTRTYTSAQILRYSLTASPLAFLGLLLVKEYFYAALIRTSLAAYSAPQRFKLRDLFSLSFDSFIRFFCARVWYFIKMFVGLLLLIIPGIYIALKYYFTGFFIIDREATISQDIALNKEITDNVKWQLFWIDLFFYFLTVIITIGVITLIFYPLIPLMQVHIYKQLLQDQYEVQEL